MVEGQAQRDDGSYFQDDKCDILQSLPHQLQKCLGLLGRDEVLSKRCTTFLKIDRVTRQTCKHEQDVNFHVSTENLSKTKQITRVHSWHHCALAEIEVACEVKFNHKTRHKWVSCVDGREKHNTTLNGYSLLGTPAAYSRMQSSTTALPWILHYNKNDTSTLLFRLK